MYNFSSQIIMRASLLVKRDRKEIEVKKEEVMSTMKRIVNKVIVKTIIFTNKNGNQIRS